jgi:AcrR family transcriptional regulator
VRRCDERLLEQVPTMSTDLLRDVLFRPTVQPAEIASAAPVRVGGTRSRAGNAMSRSRAALLAGARRAVEVSGTKISMSQVATAAGVAKATLYNHFRTRDAVLAALLDHEVDELLRQAAGLQLDEALLMTASTLSQHPVLLALARREPATTVRLAQVDGEEPNWHRARLAVEQLLSAANRGGADTVLRWLASMMVTPGTDASIAADIAVLMAGLPSVQAPVDPFFALLSR